MFALAALLFLYWSETAATVAGFVSALILLSALASPTALYPGLMGIFTRLGVATGEAVTWLLMGIVFYLFFLPFGLLFRSGRRDRLQKATDPAADTYWEEHGGWRSGSPAREKQY